MSLYPITDVCGDPDEHGHFIPISTVVRHTYEAGPSELTREKNVRLKYHNLWTEKNS